MINTFQASAPLLDNNKQRTGAPKVLNTNDENELAQFLFKFMTSNLTVGVYIQIARDWIVHNQQKHQQLLSIFDSISNRNVSTIDQPPDGSDSKGYYVTIPKISGN